MCFRVGSGRKREEFFIEVPKNSNVQLFCIRLRLIGIMDEPETFPGWRLWTGGYWIVSLDGLGSHLHGWKYFKVNKGCKTWEQVIKCVRTDRMGSVPTRLSLPICALSLIGYSLGCCQPFAQSQLWWVPASCEPWQDKKMDRWIFTS